MIRTQTNATRSAGMFVVWIVTSLTLFVGASARAADDGAPIALEVVALGVLPPTTGVDARPVGGLSGLAYDGGRWWAVCDDAKSPRVYELAIDVNIADARVNTRVVRVADLPFGWRDAEAIASDGVGGFVVGYEAPVSAIRVDRGFAFRQEFKPGERIGTRARPNRGFEAVAVRAGAGGRAEVWAVTETAIRGDGEPATFKHAALCRVVVWDRDSGEALREHAYETLRAPHGLDFPGPLAPNNTVVALEALPDGRLLVMERSNALPRGYDATIRLITPDRGERDVRAVDSFADVSREELGALRVRTIAALSDLGAANVGNLEGMSLGPILDDERGGRLLLLIADDNFGADSQRGSAIVALRMTVGTGE